MWRRLRLSCCSVVSQANCLPLTHHHIRCILQEQRDTQVSDWLGSMTQYQAKRRSRRRHSVVLIAITSSTICEQAAFHSGSIVPFSTLLTANLFELFELLSIVTQRPSEHEIRSSHSPLLRFSQNN